MTSIERTIAKRNRGPAYAPGTRIAHYACPDQTGTVGNATWEAPPAGCFPTWRYEVAWDADAPTAAARKRYNESWLIRTDR